MDLTFQANLPKQLLRPLNFNLFELRNVAGHLPCHQRLNALQKTGLPNINNPRQFVSSLKRLEQMGGTAFSLLVGMLAATGTTEFAQAEQAILVFEELSAQFIHHFEKPRLSYDDLFADLAAHLRHDSSVTNFADAISRAARNNALDKQGTGNCNFGSELAGLVLLRYNQLAGEGHELFSMHNFAFVPVDCRYGMKFDVQVDFCDWQEFEPNRVQVLSHPFSFIASYCIGEANAITSRPGALKNIGELNQALRLLALAEAINPYSIVLHATRVLIYKTLQDARRGRKSEAMWQNLSNWSWANDPRLHPELRA